MLNEFIQKNLYNRRNSTDYNLLHKISGMITRNLKVTNRNFGEITSPSTEEQTKKVALEFFKGLDKDLYDVDNCIVTKIEYPDVVLSVVLDILNLLPFNITLLFSFKVSLSAQFPITILNSSLCIAIVSVSLNLAIDPSITKYSGLINSIPSKLSE